MTTRRSFIQWIPAAGAALAAPTVHGQANPPPMLDEKDPQAVEVGYVADAKRVDKKKYPKYAATQTCANCLLYKGDEKAPAARCTLFPGKLVAGPGWCSSWEAK